MSWESSVSRSGTGRRPSRNSAMWLASQARAPNVAWNWRIWPSPSPEAVGSRQMRGSAAPVSESTKSSRAGFSGSIVKPPPPMARIVRSGGKGDRRALAEEIGRQAQLDDLLPPALDTVGAGGGGGEHDPAPGLPPPMQRPARRPGLTGG